MRTQRADPRRTASRAYGRLRRFLPLRPAQRHGRDARISYIIRDHDSERFEQKKVWMWSCVDLLQKRYGKDVLSSRSRTNTSTCARWSNRTRGDRQGDGGDASGRCRAYRAPHPRRYRRRAPLVYGTSVPQPLHARMNFHGKFEYCSLDTMRRATDVIINLHNCGPNKCTPTAATYHINRS